MPDVPAVQTENKAVSTKPDLDKWLQEFKLFNTYSEKYCKFFYDQFSRWDRLYRFELPKEFDQIQYQGRSNLVLPIIFNAVEDSNSRIYNALFGKGPIWAYTPTRPEDVYAAEMATDIIRYYLSFGLFPFYFRPTLNQFTKYGKGYGIPVWKHVYDWTPEDIPYQDEQGLQVKDSNGQALTSTKLARKLLWSGPQYEFLDVMRCRPDPDGDAYNIGRFFGIQGVKTRGELMEMATNSKSPYYRKELLEKLKVGGFPKNEYGKYRKPISGMEKWSLGQGGEVDPNLETILIEHLWKPNGVYTVANREMVIGFPQRPGNPYGFNEIPVVQFDPKPQEDEVFSIGQIEPLEDLVLEAIQKRNQRLTNVNISLAGGGVYLTDSISDLPDLIKMEPGRVYKTRNPKNVVRFEVGDVTASAFQEEAIIRSDIREAAKTNEYTLGTAATGQGDTATSVAIVNENAGLYLASLINFMGEGGFKDLAKKMLRLAWQFAPDEIIYRVTGASGLEFRQKSKAEIYGMFDVEILAKHQITPLPMRQNNILRLAELYRDDPDVDGFEMKKAVFEDFYPEKIGKILPDPKYRRVYPEKENYMLSKGETVPVDPRDDHRFHLKVHLEMIEPLKAQESGIPENIMQHINFHMLLDEKNQIQGIAQNGKPKGQELPQAVGMPDLLRSSTQRYGITPARGKEQ